MGQRPLLSAKSWNFDRLTIIGGGVIAVELATIFNNLCSHVTIVEKQKRLMAPMDDIMSQELENDLRQKGITLYCDSTVTELVQGDGGLWCTITPNGGGEPVTARAGQVLVAIGRRPNTEGLTGSDVSLKMDGGKLDALSQSETSEPGVYAIGDVCTKTQLAHVAAAEAVYVVERLAGRSHSIRLQAVPSGMFVPLPIVPNCIYTDPEIATVGITEEGAKRAGSRCAAVIFP